MNLLSEKLKLVAEWLSNEDNALLVSAEEDDSDIGKYGQLMDEQELGPMPSNQVELTPEQQPRPQASQAKPQTNYGTADWRDIVWKVQQALTQWNYNPGPIDGKLGPLTSAAIKQY